MTRLTLFACLCSVLSCGAAVAAMPSGAPVYGSSPSPAPIKVATVALLDINSASKAELQALKGDIIKGRPYKGKDDMLQKKILPQGVYDGIKDKVIAKQK